MFENQQFYRLTFYGYYTSIFFFRYNKLALDSINTDGQMERVIEETLFFAPVQSAPINLLPIKMVAQGTSHSAIVTGR